MTKITIRLPQDLADWLCGYAVSRKVSASRAISDLLVEKRTILTKEAEELSLAGKAFERILQTKTFLELSKQISVLKKKQISINENST